MAVIFLWIAFNLTNQFPILIKNEIDTSHSIKTVKLQWFDDKRNEVNYLFL